MIQKRTHSKFTNNTNKLFCFILILILLSSILLSGTVASDEQTDGPKLEYFPTSYDFEDVCVNEFASAIFDIANGAIVQITLFVSSTFNRSCLSYHPGGYSGAFKGRTSSSRTCEQPLAITQEYLSISA